MMLIWPNLSLEVFHLQFLICGLLRYKDELKMDSSFIRTIFRNASLKSLKSTKAEEGLPTSEVEVDLRSLKFGSRKSLFGFRRKEFARKH